MTDFVPLSHREIQAHYDLVQALAPRARTIGCWSNADDSDIVVVKIAPLMIRDKKRCCIYLQPMFPEHSEKLYPVDPDEVLLLKMSGMKFILAS